MKQTHIENMGNYQRKQLGLVVHYLVHVDRYFLQAGPSKVGAFKGFGASRI